MFDKTPVSQPILLRANKGAALLNRTARSNGGILASTIILAAVAFAACGGYCSRARAGQIEGGHTPWWSIDETRFGVFKQAVDDAPGEGGAALNLEVLTGKLPGSYENRYLNFFLTPRLHAGTTVAFGKTDEFYWGTTWDYKITDKMFFETSFGGAAHDGPLNEKHIASYGCTVNFRESGSLGFSLSQDWNLLFTVDHMSNAGICDTNRGLTNAGVRIGYKW